MSDALETVRKSTHNLSLAIAHNINAAGLDPLVEEWYLRHPDQIIPAIKRGFNSNLPPKLKETYIQLPSPPKAAGITFRPHVPEAKHALNPDKRKKWIEAMVALYRGYMDLNISERLSMFDLNDPGLMDCLPVYYPGDLNVVNIFNSVCRPQFACGFEMEQDVDRFMCHREPPETGPYVFYCKAEDGPDEEWLGRSAAAAKGYRVKSMDICERLLLEAIHYFMYQKHLDISRQTLCPDCIHNQTRLVLSTRTHNNYFSVGQVELTKPIRDAGIRKIMEVQTIPK